jgi:exopolyphosphatase/guanosine-5'-triphosphate,3'-diphosphate pyrophosphatase
MLDGMPLNLRRRLPGLQPERADIVVKGTLIILLIMEGLQKKEITVSESDLLEGIIWQLAASGNRR